MTLRGLTIKNGVANGGAGIQARGGASLETDDVVVVDNEARDGPGGGIRLFGAGTMATLENTEVSNNRTFGVGRPGGGISVDPGASLYVTNGWIKNNVVSDGWGGGIQAFDFGGIEVVNTDIEDNRVLVGLSGGGGIFAQVPGVPLAGPASIARQVGPEGGGGGCLGSSAR